MVRTVPDYRKKKKSLKRHEPPIGRLLGRIGSICRQPLVWAVTTMILARIGGSKGKRAAKRGALCYLLGAGIGNGAKPLFGRPQPRHRHPKKPQMIFGAFPSGHSAAEAAYIFGASQEFPQSFILLGPLGMLGHWALVRERKHYDSDIVAGALIGLSVAWLIAKSWPPARGRWAKPDGETVR